MKRKAPESINHIQISQFHVNESKFTQNNASDSDPEIKKRYKSDKSEINSTINVTNVFQYN